VGISTRVHAIYIYRLSVTVERGPAQRNGRAGPLRGINCPKSGVRRGTAVDCLRPDRSSTSHNPLCTTATRRLVRRSSDGSLSLSADFLTSVLATVNPQICGYDPSRDERAEGCDRRSRRCLSDATSTDPRPPSDARHACAGVHLVESTGPVGPAGPRRPAQQRGYPPRRDRTTVLLQHLLSNDSERVGQLTVVAFAPGLHVSDAVRAFTATHPESRSSCSAGGCRGWGRSVTLLRRTPPKSPSRPKRTRRNGLLLDRATSKDLVLVAWPGQWSQDI
jgi:hypothetical protein